MTSLGDRFSKSHKLPQKPQAAEGKGDFWGSSGWQWPLSLSQGGLGDQDLAGQVLQVRRLRRVQLDVVLGQDFEDGPQPQPPLLLGDAVPEGTGTGWGHPWGGIPGFIPLSRGGEGRDGEGHALEIRLLAQLSDGLEHQAALAHPQQARRVSRVGKDPAWEEHGNVWEPPGGELGIPGVLQGHGGKGGNVWESSGMGEHLGGEFGNVWDPPGAGVGNVWDAPGGEKPVGG